MAAFDVEEKERRNGTETTDLNRKKVKHKNHLIDKPKFQAKTNDYTTSLCFSYDSFVQELVERVCHVATSELIASPAADIFASTSVRYVRFEKHKQIYLHLCLQFIPMPMVVFEHYVFTICSQSLCIYAQAYMGCSTNVSENRLPRS